eukprot:3220018-Karenia_brevis.AAC.1
MLAAQSSKCSATCCQCPPFLHAEMAPLKLITSSDYLASHLNDRSKMAALKLTTSGVKPIMPTLPLLPTAA